MSIHRGKFDRKVTVLQVTETQNSYGEVEKTTSTYATRWAEKKYGTGSENVEADRLTPIKQVNWTFDYISGLDESMIIQDRDGEQFDIIEIEELERKRYHVCKCVRRT